MNAIREAEMQWQTQGFCQALAEIIRRNPANSEAKRMVQDVLRSRMLGYFEFAQAGVEPHDVRELAKAMPPVRNPVPQPNYGRLGFAGRADAEGRN